MDNENSFDMGYHEYAKEKHLERVDKTHERIVYAIQQFNNNDIKYDLKNIYIGHFHVWSKNGRLFNFWASTGKIQGYDNLRGIRNMIRLAERS